MSLIRQKIYVDMGKGGKEVIYAGSENVLMGTYWQRQYYFYPPNALFPLLSAYGLSKRQVDARIR